MVSNEALTEAARLLAVRTDLRELIEDWMPFGRIAGQDYGPVVRDALETFFETGEPSVARQMLAEVATPRSILKDEPVGGHEALDLLTTLLARRFDRRNAAEAAAHELERLRDTPAYCDPLTLARGIGVVCCVVPGLAEVGSLAACRSSHSGDVSGVETIVPDKCVRRLLDLVNVSGEDVLSGFEELSGRPASVSAGRRKAWVRASPALSDAEPLVHPADLAGAIEAAYEGFNAMIAFEADAAFLIERDWSMPLRIGGGLVVLHDFATGSGGVVRFEGETIVDAAAGDMIVSEGRGYDLSDAHGLARSSYSAALSDAGDCDQDRTPPRP